MPPSAGAAGRRNLPAVWRVASTVCAAAEPTPIRAPLDPRTPRALRH
ncbi:hypothetical protein ABZ178_16250 [Streptomyces massasporeus]